LRISFHIFEPTEKQNSMLLSNRMLLKLLIVSTTLTLGSCSMKEKADLIVHDAFVYTVDNQGAVVESFIVQDGKIAATGKKDELLKIYDPSVYIDAEGRPVFPGFIDAHCHFYGLALSLQWTDLVGCRSMDEVINLLPAASSGSDNWITGRGWDQNLWEVKRFPEKSRLDSLYPDTPVVLVRIDGHVVLANQKALDLAGITDGRGFAPGEVEIREGKLTGILSERAADHIRSRIPKPSSIQLPYLLKQAEKQCIATGLTGLGDAGLDLETLRLLDSLSAAGDLSLSLYAMMEPSPENIREYLLNGPYRNGRFQVCSVKLYADGSLGSRTALLTHPYSDDPSTNGIRVSSPDTIAEICRLAYENGYQVNTHCIGDSAVRMVLQVYSRFLHGRNDRRWRIEHAQVVDPADLELFGTYSIIPSVQSTHATSDMRWAGDRLGPHRIRWAYAYRDLMEQNNWIPNGTDFPIERIDPLLTFYAAVARKDLDGYPEGGFQMENALDRDEALKSITIWAAMANRDDKGYGSLEPGKYADFVILDKDIMNIPEAEIPGTRIMSVFKHGKRIFPTED